MTDIHSGGRKREDPHLEMSIESAGAPPSSADAAVIMLHGRGGTAQHILRLVDEIYVRSVIYLAPQAAQNRWYPYSGVAPKHQNEPWLSSALKKVSETVSMAREEGISRERILIFGFSQGGCLGCEYVAANPRRYGGLITLSGSLLGPEPTVDLNGNIKQTPVFFGCGISDPYVDASRVRESDRLFRDLGGDTTLRLYDVLGHEINDDEVHWTRSFIEQLV